MNNFHVSRVIHEIIFYHLFVPFIVPFIDLAAIALVVAFLFLFSQYQSSGSDESIKIAAYKEVLKNVSYYYFFFLYPNPLNNFEVFLFLSRELIIFIHHQWVYWLQFGSVPIYYEVVSSCWADGDFVFCKLDTWLIISLEYPKT